MVKSKDVFVKKKKSAFAVILIIFVILIVILAGGIFALYISKTVVVSPIALQDFKDIRGHISELNTNLKLKNKELQELQEQDSKTKNQINLRSRYYLNTKLAIYYQQYGKFPVNTLNLQAYISKIPNEVYTGNNTVYGTKNNKGGWYYDKKGSITANIKR